MKKLIFSAAVAAMTTGAFAGVAQVYDMTINVKTTKCEDGKKLLEDKCGNAYRFYRAQASYKFEGKFWGCGCATIANPIAEQYGMPRLNNGLSASEMSCEDNNNSYMFWGNKAAFHQVNFAWPLLHLVGKKSTNVEGFFVAEFFGCEDGKVIEGASLELYGAGYGTANIDNCLGETPYELALNQIKSMNGSVVGVYNVADLAGMVGCVYCGEEVGCTPFQFCPCVELRDSESAAYGTFTLKYNSSLANKVNNGKYIDEAYCFKDFVKAEFECIEEGKEEPDPTVDDKVTANYKAAVQAVNVAKQGVFVTSNAYVEAVYANAQWNKDYDDLKTLDLEKKLRNAVVCTNTENELFATYTNAIGQAAVARYKNYKEVPHYKQSDKMQGVVTNFLEDAGLTNISKGRVSEYATNVVIAATNVMAQSDNWSRAQKLFEYKQITATERDTVKAAYDKAWKEYDTAKAKWDVAIAAWDEDAPRKVKILADVKALETYVRSWYDFDISYRDAKYDWDTGRWIKEDGSKMTEAEKTAAKEEATQAVVDTKKAWDAAEEELDKAETNLAIAETACLITKGTKDCQ